MSECCRQTCHLPTTGLSQRAEKWVRSCPPYLTGLVRRRKGSGLRTGLAECNEAQSLGNACHNLSSPPQGHPFIMQFNDGNATVVSMWVCRALEERRNQQGPP